MTSGERYRHTGKLSTSRGNLVKLHNDGVVQAVIRSYISSTGDRVSCLHLHGDT